MEEGSKIYNVQFTPEEKLDKRIIFIVIVASITVIGLIFVAINSFKIIKREKEYKSFEAEVIRLQKEEEQRKQKIAEELEKKRQERLPKLTDSGKQNVENIYKSETKRVFLTFDDGPSINTAPILDILKQENIRATFFILGSKVEVMPEVVKRAYEEGHFIANHGYSHVYSSIYSSPGAVLDEYNMCNNAIQKAIGEPEYNSHLFRYPGGFTGGPHAQVKIEAEQLLKENDIVYADWNALTGDSELTDPTPEYIMSKLQDTTFNKSSLVILMHDSHAKTITVETLPQVISYLREQGYEFKNFYEIIK